MIVYRHINPSTLEPFYIGRGKVERAYFFIRKDPWRSYVKENGWPTVQILATDLTKEEAVELEEFLIEEYGRVIDGSGPLLNIQLGEKTSEETKIIQSKSRQGKNNPFYGKNHSILTKQKISASNQGKDAWNKNKKRSEQCKMKIRESLKNEIIFRGIKYLSMNHASRETGLTKYYIKKECVKI